MLVAVWLLEEPVKQQVLIDLEQEARWELY